MASPALLEVGFDLVRLRSGGRGRRVLLEREAYGPQTRPFLKWAGGKQWLVPLADALLPSDFEGRYYEPFLGGGALFFALAPRRATLSDANAELISSYVALRDDADRTIRELRSYPHEKHFFETLRERRPRAPYTRAARLIYLNRTAFNGLYRVSRAGQFNVPFGRYTRPTICNEKRLRAAARALRGVSLSASAFSTAVSRARRGDFVYFDPPYITGHTNNGFLKYNARLFSWPDQLKLAQRVSSLGEQGTRVAISNADHPAVLALYPSLYCYRVARRSAIGGGLDYRGTVQEVLLTNFPLFDMETPKLP
jgi:DNA adenine methylase